MVVHYFHSVREHELPPSLNLNHNTYSTVPLIYVSRESMARGTRYISTLPELSECTIHRYSCGTMTFFFYLQSLDSIKSNRIVKSRDSSRLWLIVKRLITIKNKSLTEVASDLQPARDIFVINSYKPSCRELKHTWIARFHDPITI